MEKLKKKLKEIFPILIKEGYNDSFDIFMEKYANGTLNEDEKKLINKLKRIFLK